MTGAQITAANAPEQALSKRDALVGLLVWVVVTALFETVRSKGWADGDLWTVRVGIASTVLLLLNLRAVWRYIALTRNLSDSAQHQMSFVEQQAREDRERALERAERDAAWRRTEFMFQQLRILDTDPGIAEAIAILEGFNSDITPSDVFVKPSRLQSEQRGKYVAMFDRLLNLLWCVGFATVELKTITFKEFGGFGWYLSLVKDNPVVVQYCVDHGYAELIAAINELSTIEEWDKSQRK